MDAVSGTPKACPRTANTRRRKPRETRPMARERTLSGEWRSGLGYMDGSEIARLLGSALGRGEISAEYAAWIIGEYVRACVDLDWTIEWGIG